MFISAVLVKKDCDRRVIMLDKNRDEVSLVLNIVDIALGREATELHKITDKNCEEFLSKKREEPIEILWIKGSDNPVYLFWCVAESGALADEAYIIFTDIDKASPTWRDLEVYVGCMFGTVYMLTYDAGTNSRYKTKYNVDYSIRRNE